MVSMDNLVVTNALPVIRVKLDAGLEGLEWTVNAYTLTFAVFLLTGAALGDRFGRRRLFAIGLTIFTLASAAAAMAPNIGTLIAARAIQGVGGAIVMPLTLTLLASVVAPERRGVAFGVWGAMGGLGVALGPVIGGAITAVLVLAVDLLGERADRPAAAAGAGRRSGRAAAAPAGSTRSVPCSSRPACSASCSAWYAATGTAGPAPRCWPALIGGGAAAGRVPRRGSGGPPRRWCR